MRFAQLHGCGNAYVFVDARRDRVDDPAALAVRAADARTGPAGGSDGLILADASANCDIRMHMFNADGSRGAMCGNGVRCLAKFVLDDEPEAGERVITAGGGELANSLEGVAPALARAAQWIGFLRDSRVEVRRLSVETDAGERVVFGYTVDGVMVQGSVDLGVASLRFGDMDPRPAGIAGSVKSERAVDHVVEVLGEQLALTCVTVGNPHVVVFVPDAGSVALSKVGRAVSAVVGFAGGANVHFVEVVDGGRLRMRPWERGSGATQACGTGACAAMVAGVATGRCGPACEVEQPGGAVFVQLAEAEADRWHGWQTGPVACVAEGEW